MESSVKQNNVYFKTKEIKIKFNEKAKSFVSIKNSFQDLKKGNINHIVFLDSLFFTKKGKYRIIYEISTRNNIIINDIMHKSAVHKKMLLK